MITYSCSDSCANKLEIILEGRNIGSACIQNDSILEVNIDSNFSDIICSDLRLLPGVKIEYLEATRCSESSSKRVFKIVKPKTMDEHFKEIGFYDHIDSLKQSKNYDSLKKEGTRRLDSLIEVGAFD